MKNSEQFNQNMIKNQIRTFGVNKNEIIEAFAKNPKINFLPDHVAYLDSHTKIDKNYEMSGEILAKILQYLCIKPTENVLIIGASSLFQATIISDIAHHVSIIPIKNIFIKNKNTATNIEFFENIHPRKFDVVIINGATKTYADYKQYLEKNGRIATFYPINNIQDNLVLTDFKIVFNDNNGYTEIKYDNFMMYNIGEM